MLIYYLIALLLISLVFSIIKKAIKLVVVLAIIVILFILYQAVESKELIDGVISKNTTYCVSSFCDEM